MQRIFILVIVGTALLMSAAEAAKRLPKDLTVKDLVAFMQQAGGQMTDTEEFMGVFKGKIGSIKVEVVTAENAGDTVDVKLKDELGLGSMNCSEGTYKTSIVERRVLDGPTVVWWKAAVCKSPYGATAVRHGVIVIDNVHHQTYRLTGESNDEGQISSLSKGIFDALVKTYR